MNEQDFDNEINYRLSLQIAKAMLEKGTVTENEYRQIDTILKKKYRPTLSILLSGNPLI